MVNYGYIISVLSDPLGLGWDLLSTADVHFKAPLIPDWIPVIQGVLLLACLYLGLSRSFLALKGVLSDTNCTNPGHAPSGHVCAFSREPLA
jgi:hypothetical protein